MDPFRNDFHPVYRMVEAACDCGYIVIRGWTQPFLLREPENNLRFDYIVS